MPRQLRTGDGEVTIGPGLLVPGTLVRTDLLERDVGLVRSPVVVDAPLITVRVSPAVMPE